MAPSPTPVSHYAFVQLRQIPCILHTRCPDEEGVAPPQHVFSTTVHQTIRGPSSAKNIATPQRHRRAPNQGISATLNRALDRVDGEWMAAQRG